VKFAVIGTGGVGGYFGGKLAKAGDDVWFVARGHHLEAMKNSGLTINATDGQYVVAPGRMTDNYSEIGPVDVVLFCVKSYDTETAASALSPLLSKETIVISLQNGVDNEEKIQRLIPRGKVYGGAAYIYATITSPGVITEPGGPRRLVFGPLSGDTTRALDIQRVMANAGIRAEVPLDITAALWVKFIFITAAGGMTALTRLTLGEILAVPATHTMFGDAMRETEAIARALHVKVPAGIVERIFESLTALATDTYSSMYHDLVNGKPLEIDAFSGTLIRYGEQLGIATPIHRAIYAALLPHHLKHMRLRG
jgi:2-dehydropantoate 2-reductase